jgi:hypothetical protein
MANPDGYEYAQTKVELTRVLRFPFNSYDIEESDVEKKP